MKDLISLLLFGIAGSMLGALILARLQHPVAGGCIALAQLVTFGETCP